MNIALYVPPHVLQSVSELRWLTDCTNIALFVPGLE
jgi:hypothetical protein